MSGLGIGASLAERMKPQRAGAGDSIADDVLLAVAVAIIPSPAHSQQERSAKPVAARYRSCQPDRQLAAAQAGARRPGTWRGTARVGPHSSKHMGAQGFSRIGIRP